MSLIEWCAASVTLISVVFGTYGSKHYFSFGALGALLYGIVFFEAQLYFSFLLQLFFIALSVVGFFQWRGKECLQCIHIRDSFKTHIIVLVLTVSLSVSTMSLFSYSQFPFTDAFLCYLSVYATWLSYSFATVHWVFWVGINSGYVYEYWMSDLRVTSALYVFLAILSLLNAWLWVRKVHLIARNPVA